MSALNDTITRPESSGSFGREPTARVDLFQSLGTQNCKLDCDAWQKWQVTQSARLHTREGTREKKRELFELKKAAGSRNGKGAVNRKPFVMQNLEASAEAGCGSCDFFLDILVAYFAARPKLDSSTIRLKWMSYAFNLELRNPCDESVATLELFCPNITDNSPVMGMSNSNPLSGDTSSEISLHWARHWIEQCEGSHELCGTGREVELPTRLIDLRSIQRGGVEGIRLVLKTGEVGTYACLSHCWGKEKMPLTTLESNLAQHLDFVPWDSLPPTFRDAAVIAKALGLEYLWIDSLCIIQDSTDDWELESSKMANVYGGAFVTIAAVSSPDFRGGCFSKVGKPDICHRIRREEKGLDVIIGLRDNSAASPDKLDISAELPLLSRGWVYQERMLSRRLLYCTRSELQLICRQSRGCECGRGSAALHRIETAKTYPTARDKQAYTAPLLARRNPGQGRFGDLEAAIHWHKVVSEYSKLELSHESDKLPALSGCAKDVSLLTGGEYLAGLWRHTLARDLLWDVHTQASSKRPAEWRAPSWSWASVKVTGGVTFAEVAESAHLRTFLDRVTAIKCQQKGKDPTGSLQSAFIRLQTRLYEVSIRRVCHNDLKIRSRGRIKYLIESQDMTASADGTPITDRCTFEDCGLPLWGGAIRIGLHPDFEYALDMFPWNRARDYGCRQAKIFLLHICDSHVERAGKEGVDYFLALKRNSEAPGNIYERVGLVRVIGESNIRRKWLMEVLDQGFRTDEQEVTLV